MAALLDQSRQWVGRGRGMCTVVLEVSRGLLALDGPPTGGLVLLSEMHGEVQSHPVFSP